MASTLTTDAPLFCLNIELNAPPQEMTWNLLSQTFFSLGALGVSEGEVTEKTLETAQINVSNPPSLIEGQGPLTPEQLDEFAHAIAPGCLNPPEKFQIFFSEEAQARQAMETLSPALKVLGLKNSEITKTLAVNYDSLFRESFKPILLKHWNIFAPWNKPLTSSIPEEKCTLILEPGMAFGTGTHETTQMCLEMLWQSMQQKTNSSPTVLDFGCGSGILALASLKLGAQWPCVAVDIDPLALSATDKNLLLNTDLCKTSESIAPMITGKTIPVPYAKPESFDLILANLLKNTILEFAPMFHELLKMDGRLIVSGLLASQQQNVEKRLSQLGFCVSPSIGTQVTGEWCAICFEKCKN